MFQGSSRVFLESFMDKEVSRMFQLTFMIFKGISKVFQGSFKKTLRCFIKKFYVAWHSSQLPEQKEGLFSHRRSARIKKLV